MEQTIASFTQYSKANLYQSLAREAGANNVDVSYQMPPMV